MGIVNIKLTDAEEMLARQYAKKQGLTLSELAQKTLLEKIQQEDSMNLYQKYLLGRKNDSQ